MDQAGQRGDLPTGGAGRSWAERWAGAGAELGVCRNWDAVRILH